MISLPHSSYYTWKLAIFTEDGNGIFLTCRSLLDNFDKIKNDLGFKISKTVPEGIADIYKLVTSGIIEDPDHRMFYNVYNEKKLL